MIDRFLITGILRQFDSFPYPINDQSFRSRSLPLFDFRYNERAALGVDDDERFVKAAAGIKGKPSSIGGLVGNPKPRKPARPKRQKRIDPPPPIRSPQLSFPFIDC
jgi:hypothetical protein